MTESSIKFSKEELLNVVGTQLARLIHGGMAGDESSSTDGDARRKRGKRTHTKPQDVSDKQIVALIRAKGPQRVVEIQEATGLSSSAAHKKVKELKAQNVLREVKEGTFVRYDVTRGGSAARRTARKTAPRGRPPNSADAAKKTSGRKPSKKVAAEAPAP